MAKYREDLPQIEGGIFLTDGGLETTLIFNEGLNLPEFAAFDLLKNDEGREKLNQYFSGYAEIARKNKIGFILESPTWRASSIWGEKLGYSNKNLKDFNHKAIELLQEVRGKFENEETQIVISGCIGPMSDNYDPKILVSEDEAQGYHSQQIASFAETEADMISAFTMSNVTEAIGVTRAAVEAKMPVVISFAVEPDGKLPSGVTLQDAIKKVDDATDEAPAYYMINCAHSLHFNRVLVQNNRYIQRIRGIRAHSSNKSRAELKAAKEADYGNPNEIGYHYYELTLKLYQLNVFGGCCGTNLNHAKAICKSCIHD